MLNNLFREDEDTRGMLSEISSLFGVKVDIVRQVWQFTVFTMLLKIASADESKLTRFTIPYIGSMGLKYNGTIATSKGVEPDLDVFVSLSDAFKNALSKAQNGNYAELSNYIQTKYIEPILDSISIS